MARAKRTIDKEEVDEIIYLKLKELGGMKKRLTYNSVFTFNKEIANNPKYKRKNGELFTLYGYDFWASSYNNEDYYGRQRINEIKNTSNVIVAGKEFIPEVEDIHALVNDYYKKPEVLYKKLAKVFEMDKNKLKNLAKDYLVYDGLKNMFNDEKLVELSKTNGINNIDTNNVLSLKREERRKRRNDLF